MSWPFLKQLKSSGNRMKGYSLIRICTVDTPDLCSAVVGGSYEMATCTSLEIDRKS